MKMVKRIVLVLVAVIVIGLIVLYLNLNGIIRSTVEKQATNSLQVPTTLGGANLSLFGGDVNLTNLQVASPAGFSDQKMMSLGSLDVDTSYGGLRSDPVRVQSIAIGQPKLLIEMKGRDFNIKKFIDSLPKGEDKPPAEGGEPMKVIIDRLTVNGAQVILRTDPATLSSLPGLSGIKNEYSLTLPAIEMNQIGTGEGNQNGAALKEVATQLVTTMAAKAAESPDLPPELRALLTGDLSAIKAQISAEARKHLDKAIGQAREKIGGEAGKVLGDLVKDPEAIKKDPGQAAKDTLGGLLKGDGDKKPAATQPIR